MDEPTFQAGWYEVEPGVERYHDGFMWTEETRSVVNPSAPYGSPAPSPSLLASQVDGEAPLDKPLYGASFQEACKRLFTRWNQFAGRSSRSEYWWAFLAIFLANLVLNFIPGVGFIASLLLLVPFLSLTVRRLHDTNRSAWWLAVPITANVLYFVAAVLFVVILFASSDGGSDTEFLAGTIALAVGFTAAATVLNLLAIFLLSLKEKAAGARFDRGAPR